MIILKYKKKHIALRCDLESEHYWYGLFMLFEYVYLTYHHRLNKETPLSNQTAKLCYFEDLKTI